MRARNNSLLDLSLETIARSPQQSISNGLQNLPEELCIELFQRVLHKGKLTPALLDSFIQAGNKHKELSERIKQLKISSWVPPLIKSDRDGWLGQRPPLW